MGIVLDEIVGLLFRARRRRRLAEKAELRRLRGQALTEASPRPDPATGSFRWPWILSLSGGVAVAFGAMFYAMSVMLTDTAAGAEFSTTVLSAAYGGFVLVGGGLAFVIGGRADRVGVRSLTIAGFVIGAVGSGRLREGHRAMAGDRRLLAADGPGGRPHLLRTGLHRRRPVVRRPPPGQGARRPHPDRRPRRPPLPPGHRATGGCAGMAHHHPGAGRRHAGGRGGRRPGAPRRHPPGRRRGDRRLPEPSG